MHRRHLSPLSLITHWETGPDIECAVSLTQRLTKYQVQSVRAHVHTFMWNQQPGQAQGLSKLECSQSIRNLKFVIVHLIRSNKATQETRKSHFPQLPGSLSIFLFVPLLHPFPSFIQTDKCFSGAWATVWTKWDGLLCGFWQRKLQLILWLEIWVQKAEKHWAVNQSQSMGLSGLQQAVSENLCVGKCVCGPGTYWHMYRLETRLVLTLLLWLLWSYWFNH